MGLTIHYTLAVQHWTRDNALAAVTALRETALTAGFDKVSELFINDDPQQDHTDDFGAFYPGRLTINAAPQATEPVDADVEPKPYQDSEAHLPEPMTDEEIQAAADDMIAAWEENRDRREMGLPAEEGPNWADELATMTDGAWIDVQPLQTIWFFANADGSEPLILGLARYPATVRHEIRGVPQDIDTGVGEGWHWEGFSKTQYASLPQHGGEDAFVRAHRAIITVLDKAIELGITAKVSDEGGYFEHRDEAQLRKEVHRWNAIMARFAGRLKDQGSKVQGPIFSHPAFEHLEADGEKAMRELREKYGKDR